MKVISETHRVYYIKHLRLYYYRLVDSSAGVL